MYYILFYEVGNDYIDKQAAFREDHLNPAREVEEEGMEAIRLFAGSNPSATVVNDEAKALLSTFDDHVKHFEAVSSTPIIDNGVIYFGSTDNYIYALH